MSSTDDCARVCPGRSVGTWPCRSSSSRTCWAGSGSSSAPRSSRGRCPVDWPRHASSSPDAARNTKTYITHCRERRSDEETMAELTIRPEEIREALDRFVQNYQPETSTREEVGT